MLGAPFDLPGDDRGVLCVHGFTGTPYEMRYLGQRLHDRGLTVVGPALPGHTTSVEDLDATTWRDWSAAVDQAFDALLARCRRVAVVGQSLGGLLALYLASRRSEVAAVASLAAPLWLDGLGGLASRWTGPGGVLNGRIGRLPKLGGSDIRDRRLARINPSYPAIPTRALAELVAFMGVVDAALPAVNAPLLVVHGQRDHTAPVASARRIAMRARAARTRILPESFHLVAIDVERDIVAAEVAAFFEARLRA
jgi:carboxylesterase